MNDSRVNNKVRDLHCDNLSLAVYEIYRRHFPYSMQVDICEYRIVEERNVFIQSVLVLCRIQYNDYSDYTCFVEGDNSSAVATTSVVLDPGIIFHHFFIAHVEN